MAPVPRIKDKIKNLGGRYKIVNRLISPIAKRGNGVIIIPKSFGYTYILGASDSYEQGNDYLKWRFRTNIDGFYGQYYERWNQYDSDTYYLDRIYFHIIRYNNVKRIEEDYVLLHCDSSEPDSSANSKYKKSPHLHICCAEQPLPHSHIALTENVSEIYKSLDNLDQAVQNAVQLLMAEILGRLV